MDDVTKTIDVVTSSIVMLCNGVTKEEAGEGWYEVREQLTDLIRMVKALEKARHQRLYEKWDNPKVHSCGICV